MKGIWTTLSKGQPCRDSQEEMSKGMKNISLIRAECSLTGKSCKKDGRVNGKDIGKSSALNVWCGIRCNTVGMRKILYSLKQ